MNTRFLLFLLSVAVLGCESRPAKFDASTVKWSDTGTGHSPQMPKTILSLLGSGYFFAPQRDDTSQLIAAWLKEHPKAVVVPVYTLERINTNLPGIKLTHIWVVDGSANLNVELVRQGCFPPGTQVVGKEVNLQIPQGKYDAFLKEVEAAGNFADVNDLGVWAGDYGKNDWLAPGRR